MKKKLNGVGNNNTSGKAHSIAIVNHVKPRPITWCLARRVASRCGIPNVDAFATLKRPTPLRQPSLNSFTIPAVAYEMQACSAINHKQT